MKLETLEDAITESRKFIDNAERAIVRFKKDCPTWEEFKHSGNILVVYTHESAATRRASMDLTRKLADLRQGT